MSKVDQINIVSNSIFEVNQKDNEAIVMGKSQTGEVALFEIKADSTDYSKQARANIIACRINRLINKSAQYEIKVEGGLVKVILAKSSESDAEVLVTVTTKDAQLAGKSQDELAREWKEKIINFLQLCNSEKEIKNERDVPKRKTPVKMGSEAVLEKNIAAKQIPDGKTGTIKTQTAVTDKPEGEQPDLALDIFGAMNKPTRVQKPETETMLSTAKDSKEKLKELAQAENNEVLICGKKVIKFRSGKEKQQLERAKVVAERMNNLFRDKIDLFNNLEMVKNEKLNLWEIKYAGNLLVTVLPGDAQQRENDWEAGLTWIANIRSIIWKSWENPSKYAAIDAEVARLKAVERAKIEGSDFKQIGYRFIRTVNDNISEADVYRILAAVEEYSKQFELDPLLFLCLICKESLFNPTAANSMCFGLTQIKLKDENGNWITPRLGLTPENKLEIEVNIRAGATYLSQGSSNLFYRLAGYNAGHGMGQRSLNCAFSASFRNGGYLDILNTYDQTKHYVYCIYNAWQALKRGDFEGAAYFGKGGYERNDLIRFIEKINHS